MNYLTRRRKRYDFARGRFGSRDYGYARRLRRVHKFVFISRGR